MLSQWFRNSFFIFLKSCYNSINVQCIRCLCLANMLLYCRCKQYVFTVDGLTDTEIIIMLNNERDMICKFLIFDLHFSCFFLLLIVGRFYF